MKATLITPRESSVIAKLSNNFRRITRRRQTQISAEKDFVTCAELQEGPWLPRRDDRRLSGFRPVAQEGCILVRIRSLRGQGRVCARFVDCLVCRQLCVILKEQSDFTDEICPTLSTISRLSKTQVRRCSTIGHLMIHEGLVD